MTSDTSDVLCGTLGLMMIKNQRHWAGCTGIGSPGESNAVERFIRGSVETGGLRASFAFFRATTSRLR